MAKRMTYKHNKTLDRLLLAATSLRSGKMQTASEALEEIIEDSDGTVEDDIETLNALQQAAFDEEGEPHLEDEADDLEATFGDDDDDADDSADDLDDEDEDEASVAKASVARLKGKKVVASTRKASVSRARKVVANLTALRSKTKRR